jgi:hypothetical protein
LSQPGSSTQLYGLSKVGLAFRSRLVKKSKRGTPFMHGLAHVVLFYSDLRRETSPAANTLGPTCPQALPFCFSASHARVCMSNTLTPSLTESTVTCDAHKILSLWTTTMCTSLPEHHYTTFCSSSPTTPASLERIRGIMLM